MCDLISSFNGRSMLSADWDGRNNIDRSRDGAELLRMILAAKWRRNLARIDVTFE